MNENDNDILERLRHPEREAQRRRQNGNLFLRNILNGVFMLMAATAMIGLVVTWHSPQQPTWCYVLGLLAVVVKMAEAMLRMPGMKRTPRQGRFAESRNGATGMASPSGGKASADGEKASAGDNNGEASA